jgi:sensor histidine kinase regulating citrate/malate metabolism
MVNISWWTFYDHMNNMTLIICGVMFFLFLVTWLIITNSQKRLREDERKKIAQLVEKRVRAILEEKEAEE